MKLLNLTRRYRHFLTTLIFLTCSMTAVPATADPTDLDASFKITGKVADISDTTRKAGLVLQVGLRDISYEGQVERTLIDQKENGGVTLWLEVRDINLTVQRTEITAPRRRADCGPLQISLGNRRTMWIAFDAVLSNQQDGSQVNLSQVRFELPQDNWQVGSPAWVKTRGIGMNEALVVNGLRSELSGKRAELESQIHKMAPNIFSQAISHLKQRQTSQSLTLQE